MNTTRFLILALVVALLTVAAVSTSQYFFQQPPQQAQHAVVLGDRYRERYGEAPEAAVQAGAKAIEAAACPRVAAGSLSTRELRKMLDGRYERRVGLPW